MATRQPLSRMTYVTSSNYSHSIPSPDEHYGSDILSDVSNNNASEYIPSLRRIIIDLMILFTFRNSA